MNYRKNNLITRLADSIKSRTGLFSDTRMKEAYTIIQAARNQSLLGANRHKSICLNEWVNVANELLRAKYDSGSVDSLAPDEAYAFIALISLGVIKNSHQIAA